VHTDRPPGEICLALADRVEDYWSADYWTHWYASWQSHAITLRRSERDHVETGAPPIKTKDGWLFFYSYIVNYFGGGPRVFGIEAALLDLEDPEKIIGRTYPFFVPQEIYEHYGVVPDIVFPTSAIDNGETIDLYYGAADTVCAKTTIKTKNLLETLKANGNLKTLTRARQNPILSPQGDGFEKIATFNAAAIDIDNTAYIFYRAMGSEHTSTVGLAISKDGVTIDERLREPCYVPRADFEMKKREGNSGCEDPRVVQIGDRLYMTYTAYDGVKAPRGAITSISVKDFLARKWDAWELPVHVTPDQVDDKDVGLLPEPIKGQYLLYHRVSGRICADLLPDLSFKKPVSRCIEIMGPREGMWDALKVGIAGPPIKVTDASGHEGWLLIYHGVSRRSRYRLGAALLDPGGTIVLARTADPIFEAVEEYETVGEVGNVVFACGQIVRGDTLYVYYGGGDRVLGVATGSLSNILEALS
jgi:beta-1,2-mannobiose phosphorylase / 1,2-beta-oligomannan phosphorylase